MPSLATAAGAPLRRGPCAPRRQPAHASSPSSSSLPSPALSRSTRLAATASVPPLVQQRPRPSLTAVRAASPDAATGARTPSSGGQMLVFVPPHPLIKHSLGLRPAQRADALRHLQECHGGAWSAAHIRSFHRLADISTLNNALLYRKSPTITGEIETPVAVSSVEFIDPREPVMVVPILRAGLAMAEYASSILPATKTYHLGLHRDEETLQPSIYLNNLPDKIPEGTRVLIVDPMLATGGTIVAAIDLLLERGVTGKQIKVVSAVAAPPALQKLSNKFPGFIVPGLGDAGDRSFAT